MKVATRSDAEVQNTAQSGLMDVLIRLALIFALAWVCYLVLSPFLTLAVWSIILAVTLYPIHQAVTRHVWKKQWLASLIIVVVGLVAIGVPMALLVDSFADTVRGVVNDVQNDTLQIPPPSESVHGWPVVG